MPAVHVRDIPEPVLEALKRRANAPHRSLKGELLHILEQAADPAQPAKMNGLGLSPQEAIENARSFLARARLLAEDAGTAEHLLRLVDLPGR